MTPQTVAHIQAQKNARNALQRVEELEANVNQIGKVINGVTKDLQEQLSTMSEVVDALVVTMGPEAVQKVMLQNRKEKEERRMATERQQVVAALEGGVIATGTVVSEKSILVLSEKDKDGNLLEIGSTRTLSLNQLEAFARDALMGKAVGARLDLLDSTNYFELVELYDRLPPKAPEVTPETSTVEAK